MFIVIAYDIPDNKRRYRVNKILGNYGKRIQYSVFECEIQKVHFEQMKEKLQKVTKTNEDNIRFYFICKECYNKALIWADESLTKYPNYYLI